MGVSSERMDCSPKATNQLCSTSSKLLQLRRSQGKTPGRWPNGVSWWLWILILMKAAEVTESVLQLSRDHFYKHQVRRDKPKKDWEWKRENNQGRSMNSLKYEGVRSRLQRVMQAGKQQQGWSCSDVVGEFAWFPKCMIHRVAHSS